MEANTTVWLTKPIAPQDADSVAVMRWAIEEDAAREGSLAGECLAAARAAGLSTEDTYVFLAYELLLRLEEQQQRHMYLSDVAPFIEPLASSPRVNSAPSSPGVAARLVEQVGRLARNTVGRVLHLEGAATGGPAGADTAVGHGH
jgi:hypothetical protein